MISIHAPTRGATFGNILWVHIIKFQSTLPREERHYGTARKDDVGHFNPRSHERSDAALLPAIGRIKISIHAPTRGATEGKRKLLLIIDFNPRSHERSDKRMGGAISGKRDFNPRSHERSDMPATIGITVTSIFQSTLPREERQTAAEATAQAMDFNPRSHERSDTSMNTTRTVSSNFNPRSHERSDKYNLEIADITGISIHAPTRGATE